MLLQEKCLHKTHSMIELNLVKGYAGIAQLVEHLTCNEDVAGSSPVSSSI